MNDSAKELYTRAQFAFAAERYNTTVEICNEVLEIDPECTEAVILSGNAHLVQNHFIEAEDSFRKVIVLEPTIGEHYFNLGNSLFGQQRLSNAMQQYAQAIQLGCKDEVMQKIYYIVGIINQLDGKNVEALANYAKSEAIPGANVDRADILLKRIQIYVEQNNLEKAENCAQQLKLLVPSEFKSYQLLFQLYLEQRKVQEAASVLDDAEVCCRLTPETVTEITFDKAMLHCFMAEQYPEQSEKHFGEALEILSAIEGLKDVKTSDRYEAIITRADIYLKLGRLAEAKNLVATITREKLPELSEYVERANYIMIKCLSQTNDYAEVHDYAARLKESDNLFYRHYGYYAEAFSEKQLAGGTPSALIKYVDKYNYAIAYYKNCTVSMPGDFLAYLYRAKCYVDIGKFDKAEELCRILPEDAQKTLRDYIQQEKRRWTN